MDIAFLSEPAFRNSYNLGAETGSWGIEPKNKWRVYVACWAAKNCLGLDGDFVECGTYKGGLARAVIQYVNFNTLNKRFYLFDTFEGFDKSQLSDLEIIHGINEQYSHYEKEDVYEQVKSLFEDDKVTVIKGTVPESLQKASISKVAFLSIDMNCAEPEVAAMHYFWDKLVPGALVVFDDYEWPQHEAQREALNNFAQEKNTQILPLPTGQGIILKK
jgi:hypothetical protein